jgi:hypothetical protein
LRRKGDEGRAQLFDVADDAFQSYQLQIAVRSPYTAIDAQDEFSAPEELRRADRSSIHIRKLEVRERLPFAEYFRGELGIDELSGRGVHDRHNLRGSRFTKTRTTSVELLFQ